MSATSWKVFSIIVLSFFDYSHSIEDYRITHAKRIASYIDNTVSPCKDFYQYACGNYITALRKGKYFVFKPEDQIMNFMHDVLMEPFNSTGDNFSAEDKAKMFYQSCMKVDHFKYPKSDAFLRLLDSVGGWPAINPTWSPDNFDWFQFELVAAPYDIDIFIYHFLDADQGLMELTSHQFNLETYGFNLFQPYSRDFQLAKGAAMQIMKMYGVPKSASKRIWNEIVEFGKLWKSFKTYYDWNEETKIDNLMEEVPNVDWEAYLKVKFENYTTLEPDMLYIYDIHSLNDIGKLFKGNERAAANYASIRLLLGLHTELHAERYNQKFCYDQLPYDLASIEGALFLARYSEEEKIEKDIRNIFEYVKDSYRRSIEDVDWLSSEVKQRLITKVNTVQLKLPTELHPINFEALNEEYRNLEVFPQNDYFQNFLAVKKFSQKRKYLKFFGYTNFEEISTTADYAFYEAEANSITFEALGIHKPYYFRGFPFSYNFGTIATALGHEFGHAFDPTFRLYDELGEIVAWDDFSEQEYSQRENCFLNYYNAIQLDELHEAHNASISLDENIATSLAIRHAYFAYKNLLQTSRKSLDMPALPRLNFSSDQVFFLAFGQKFCTKLTREEMMESQNEVHGPNRIALIGSVSNFDEFSKAFNCDLGTPMNPEEKCTLF